MSGPHDRVRVLVVDDSAFARKVIREILTGAGFEVIDHARDGLEALEKIERLRPDVVTLDLMMPHLDGLGVLSQLQDRAAPPGVVIVSTSSIDTEAGVTALQHGAVGVVQKPTALATAQLYDLRDELVAQVQLAAAARPQREPEPVEEPEPPPAQPTIDAARTDLVVIGTSTGGPRALTRLISALPAELPVPVAVALHIPVGYTQPLAERLDAVCGLHVFEAYEGAPLEPGTVVIARAGLHLRVRRTQGQLVARLDSNPALSLHHPAVDELFGSAAETCGERTLAVVLTGMGNDGTVGCRALRERGARILTEARSSCVVWGMPRSVWEAGLADEQVPLSRMAQAIVRWL